MPSYQPLTGPFTAVSTLAVARKDSRFNIFFRDLLEHKLDKSPFLRDVLAITTSGIAPTNFLNHPPLVSF